MTSVDDMYRYCIYCGADCHADEPEHSADCPSSTGLWPVEVRSTCPFCRQPWHEISPFCCGECGAEFKEGDHYAHRKLESNVFECICLGCKAKEELAI